MVFSDTLVWLTCVPIYDEVLAWLLLCYGHLCRCQV